MASVQEILRMASNLPAGFVDLNTFSRQPCYSLGNIMGVVIDCMPPIRTRKLDFMNTLTIRDASLLTSGLRITFFRSEEKELPPVVIGDVVLLRKIKLSEHPKDSGNTLGISNFGTEFIVFSGDQIVKPDFRRSYAVHNQYLPHCKSRPTDNPSIHEQQWAITLHDSLPQTSLPRPLWKPSATNTAQLVRTSVPSTRESVQSDSNEGNRDENTGGRNASSVPVMPTTAQSPPHRRENFPARQKFSLIENVEVNRFYDLAGEVIKTIFNDSNYLEMYITDYTSNKILPDRENSSDFQSLLRNQWAWPGPLGRMTLKVELHQPHAFWVQQNVKEGDIVFVRNTRVKMSSRGTEVHANLFPDNFNPDRIDVQLLSPSDSIYKSIITRKREYYAKLECKVFTEEQAKSNGGVLSKGAKKRKRRKGNAKIEQPSAHINPTFSAGKLAVDDQSNTVNNEHPRLEGAVTNEKARPVGTTDRYALNPYVKCLWDKVPLSTYQEIVHNPNRWNTTPNGITYEMPFTNVKHRTHLRVVDFYPHVLQDFSQLQRSSSTIASGWQWDFWLVVVARQSSEPEKRPINLHVCGIDAQNLLDEMAADLTINQRTLDSLREKLFLLWGDLAERKEAFLKDHPNIKPDPYFSTQSYGIEADNRPFEACIAECGVLAPGTDSDESDDPRMGWEREYRLFDTWIRAHDES